MLTLLIKRAPFPFATPKEKMKSVPHFHIPANDPRLTDE